MPRYHPTVEKITQLLDVNGCVYQTFEHEAVRTSEEAAALRPEYTIHQGAKALIVQIKKKGVAPEFERMFVQLVVPGDAKFDTKKVRAVLNAKDTRFATEAEVVKLTDGVVPGGVPPFGNLFGLPVYVDVTLLENEEIIFNAGDRRYSIVMRATDYVRIVQPTVVSIIVS